LCPREGHSSSSRITPEMDPYRIQSEIEAALLTIYDSLAGTPELVYSNDDLERLLRDQLIGVHLPGEIRTRSKYAKGYVAQALGYPVPSSFRKTWNEELDPTRRHALLRVDDSAIITAARVVDGEMLARLDTTGTLTGKYQASRLASHAGTALVSEMDTERFRSLLHPVSALTADELDLLDPLQPPRVGAVLSIASTFERLQALRGTRIERAELQERNRGAALQRLVCQVMGLPRYADHGQFPDIPCQALEIKAQASRTIDLGLVMPTSTEIAHGLGGLRHCDARYCVAELEPVGAEFEITAVVITTGERFFDEFRVFEGLGQNQKLQMHLPDDFFT
jgi:hypothetical protein